jgi:hypothetical protein
MSSMTMDIMATIAMLGGRSREEEEGDDIGGRLGNSTTDKGQ